MSIQEAHFSVIHHQGEVYNKMVCVISYQKALLVLELYQGCQRECWVAVVDARTCFMHLLQLLQYPRDDIISQVRGRELKQWWAGVRIVRRKQAFQQHVWLRAAAWDADLSSDKQEEGRRLGTHTVRR